MLLNRNSRGPGAAMYHELLITDSRTVDPFVMSYSEIPRMQCEGAWNWVAIISISASVPHGSQVDMNDEWIPE